MIDKSILKRVEALLIEDVKYRNSDMAILAKMWLDELGDQTLSARGFLAKINHGEVSNPESIRRCRQQLQEQRPELKGSVSKARMSYQEVVKQELRDTKAFAGGQEALF